MSFQTNSQSSTKISNMTTPKSTTATEQLNSTAKVFCEAVNQIVKAYLANYHETNMFQSINISFAQKVIKKTKISFSQLVITLVYLNRYYQSCIKLNKHIPGHKESIIPSLSHVVLLCIIQAERYITDVPHGLSWWAGICAGRTKSVDINKWQLDFFDTIDYKLYVHPEKDFNIFKVEIKRLAARLFSNVARMPSQFRRSINLGNNSIQTSTKSTSSTSTPSQPNIPTVTNRNNSMVQPRILLSPSNIGSNTQPIMTTNRQNSMLASPMTINTNIINNNQSSQNRSNLEIPILNITNSNLTTSPVEIGIERTMINQIRSPSSIYSQNSSNSSHSALFIDTRNQLLSTSPIPPVQNPNNLMVHSGNLRSPIKNTSTTSSSSSTSLLVLNNNEKQASTSSKTNIQQSPISYGINMTSSPIQTQEEIVQSPEEMSKTEEMNYIPRPLKRKRAIYDPYQISMVAAKFLKASKNVNRNKSVLTISPEELEYQPNTPSSHPIEENNSKENSQSLLLARIKDKGLMYSPSMIQNSSLLKNDQNKQHRFRGEQQNTFPTLDKGKNEASLSSITTSGTSSNIFRLTEESINCSGESSFLKETIPNSSENVKTNLVNDNTEVTSEEIIVTSLLLASNNSTSLSLIPVSPPLTPK